MSISNSIEAILQVHLLSPGEETLDYKTDKPIDGEPSMTRQRSVELGCPFTPHP
jgi:hypothetical protein